jgi:hypothetical protein
MKSVKRALRVLLGIIAMMIAAYALFSLIVRPRNDREWNADQVILPEVTFNGDWVTIKNVRNFKYETTSKYTPAFYDRTLALDRIRSVDFVVEPFSTNPGAAHTLLSFGFEDGSYVAISVEIRKEKGRARCDQAPLELPP